MTAVAMLLLLLLLLLLVVLPLARLLLGLVLTFLARLPQAADSRARFHFHAARSTDDFAFLWAWSERE